LAAATSCSIVCAQAVSNPVPTVNTAAMKIDRILVRTLKPRW
jgi:hypothetical protein